MEIILTFLGIHLLGAFIAYGVIFADFVNDWAGMIKEDRKFALWFSLCFGWMALLIHVLNFDRKTFTGFRLW